MVDNVFQDILLQGVYKGKAPGKSREAREWFRQKAKEVQTGPVTVLHKTRKLTPQLELGNMYFYQYGPKWRKKLPYYDAFPLIFPLHEYGGGRFLGINFHYLPLHFRAKLMDALYELRNNKRMDESTKIRASFEILKNSTKYKAFRPCLKQYLRNKVVSSGFLEIHPAEWDIALFLPLARFKKQSQEQVWRDSRKIIRDNS